MKQKWNNYTFSPGNAGNGTITLTGLNVSLEQILIISDANKNTIIYNFADPTYGQTAFTQGANSVLTLTANTSGYSASDKLLIYYDDNASPTAISSLPALATGGNTIGGVFITTALPTGANTIGAVNINGTVPISGSVSITGTPSVTVTGNVSLNPLPAGSAAIGTVGVTSLPALAAGGNTIGNVGINGNVTVNPLPTGGNTIGAVTISGTPTVNNAAGENHLGEIGGRGVAVSASFTRPANTTAYAANYVVSNSTSATTLLSFSLARVNGGTGYITGARIVADQKSITPRFRVHLFNASTPTVAADGANNKELYADESKVIGIFDLPAMTTGADTTNSTCSRAYDYTIRIPFKCAAGSTTIYAYLETLDAFTPASAGNYTLTLEADLD